MQPCLAFALLALVFFFATAHASSDGLTLKLHPRVINASVLQPATASRSIFGSHDAHLGIVRAWTTVIEVGFPPEKWNCLWIQAHQIWSLTMDRTTPASH